jgi:Ser/Thr protein kinase RdoA (MazF antagonist)
MTTASGTESTNSIFTASAPRVNEAGAEDVIFRHYGLEGRARMLTSERDSTFQFAAADGQEYVLKIANSAEDPAVAEFQNRALLHVAQVAPDLAVPKVIPTIGGEYEITLELGGSHHIVRMLSFLQGEQLYKVPASARQRQELGAYLARIANALEGFSHRAASHEILWDLKHSERLFPLAEYIEDADRRRLACRFLDNFMEFVAPLLPTLRSQVVHNDFNPHNILVDPANPDLVTGVLDFGDIVETPLVVDVAVACSYQLPEEGHPLSYAAEFVSAYHREKPLRADEIDVLFDLIGTRHAMTVAITEWRASRHPENRDYILRNNPRASRGMSRFADVPRDEARAIFRTACGME